MNTIIALVRDCLLEAWQVLLELAPWLLVGFVAAGLLHILFSRDFLARHLGRPGAGSVLRASLLGIPLPLCSCGVIPTALALRQKGASRGASIGFLISTPQTGVDSFLVSGTLLGWPFAVFKILAALVTGMLGGLLTDLRDDPNDLYRAPAAETSAPHPPWGIRIRQGLQFGLGRLPSDIYLWIVAGVLAAGIVAAVLPPNYLAGVDWVHGPWGMLAALGIALPMYVCTTASVPIAAALVYAGLPPGAALVFLMAGPASNLATLGAVYRSFGMGVTAIYLVTVAGSSLVFGAFFNFVVVVRPSADPLLSCLDHDMPGPTAKISAVILLAIFLWHGIQDLLKHWRPDVPA